MIDPRLSWFAIGATCSAVLFGWPWHPRFSRYSRMQNPDWRCSFNHENTNRPSGPPPFNLRRKDYPSAPGMRRIYYDMPSTIAECGGPCAAGPQHCDCGALWHDEPVRLDPGNVQRGNGSGGPTTPKPEITPKPQYPGGYISLDGAQPLRGRRFQPLPDELDAYCPQDNTPNPPPEVP